jgi:ribonucleoside-diphosphate reductase beta chain
MRSYKSVMNAINSESIVFRLYKNAKKYGVWNPADIDFSQDKKDWGLLTEDQRDEVTTLIA